MSYFTLQNAKVYMSTGLDPAKTISDISNANPAVCTSTAHGLSANDEGVLFTGWEDFNESVFRIGGIATNTFTLPGYDSSDTTLYPQGSDPGTFQKVSGWQQIGQVLGGTGQGGDARSVELNPWGQRNGVRLYTGFNPSSLELELGYDRSRTDQQLLEGAARVFGKRALRFVLEGPAYCYLYGVVTMSPMPIFGDVLRRKLTFASQGGTFTAF